MPLITQCTVCGAQFKVVPDQLKIAGGWVRCGHCDEVFNAARHVVDPAPPMARLVSDGEASAAPTPETAEQRRARRRARIAERQASRLRALAESLAAEDRAQSEQPEHAASTDTASTSTALADTARLEAGASPLPAADPYDDSLNEVHAPPQEADTHPTDPTHPALAEPVPWGASATTLDDPAATAAPPSFWRDEATTPATTATRRKTWPWVVAAVLLAVGLAGQWVVQQRDTLMAQSPAVRVALQPLCAQLGCRVGPPREPGAVVIDGSAFTRLDATAFRMALTLRNRVGHPVATPSVEVTLTDADDRAVLRRVLSPSQLGAPANMTALGEWSEPLRLTLPEANAASVVGYRLLTFYP